MSLAVDRMLERFTVLYGPPQTDNPDMFVEEYRKALHNYADAVIDAAADKIILEQDKPFWPTPGKCRQAARDAAAKISAQWQRENATRLIAEDQAYLDRLVREQAQIADARIRFAPPDVQEAMRKQKEEALKYLDSIKPAEPQAMDVSKPAFERMQRGSTNGGLHRLSDLSRRMTGEHDE